MQFGITMFPTDLTVLPHVFATMVEEREFDGLYFGEHSHIPLASSDYPSGGEVPDDFYRFHDTIGALTAAAAVTTQITLGSSTLVIPDHDAVMLAKRLSTLDHVSEGRLIVGVGVGWNLAELANHGADPAKRWTIFRETIDALKTIWTNEVASYDGDCVRFTPMRQWPKPVQDPHPPVFIGGSGPKVTQRIVEMGDGWMASGRHLDGDDLRARVVELAAAATEAGRGPIPVMIQQGTPTAAAIEDYLDMGLHGCTLRVDPASRADLERQLDDLAALVAPYRSR